MTTWLSKTLTAILLIAAFYTTSVDGDEGCLSTECVPGTTRLYLTQCLLTDADFVEIGTCLDTVGRTTIEDLFLSQNGFTTVPSDLLTGLTSLEFVGLYLNDITSVDEAAFQGLEATLQTIDLSSNQVTAIPANLFAGLGALYKIDLESNLLTALPTDLFAGLDTLEILTLSDNPLTELPTGIFDDLSSVRSVLLRDMTALTTLPPGLFSNMGSLVYMTFEDSALTALDVGTFDGQTSMDILDFRNNDLTTLPEGVFENVGTGSSLRFLYLSGNEGLQCIPTSPATGDRTTYSYSSTNTHSDVPANDGLCACTDVATCDDGFVCNPGVDGYTCVAEVVCATDADCNTGVGEACCETKLICEVPDAAGACGDPHMTGFRGQKFDFTGEDGKWYAVVSDLPYLHLNMRVTAPVPSLPEITYITGISIMTTDDDGLNHAIVISVSDPHTMESACPVGMSSCLADGALHVVANGEEIMLTPDVVTLAPGVAIAAVNLPGECRSFGFEQYWEQKKLQLAQPGRRLSGGDVLQDMSDWVLADPTATNMMECEEYVAAAVDGGSLFEHQSEHASFQIMTPTTTIRLSHGRLHQLPMRDPTGQYDLPDHLAWQMNLAIDHSDLSLDAAGILGETLVPTLDHNGANIMQGMDAIRGVQKDYRVSGPLEILFSQDQHHDQ